MALTQPMRAIVLFAASMGVLGCSHEERDVLREFPAPRLMSQTSENPSLWKLELTEATRLEVRFGNQSAGGVAFRAVKGALEWAPQARGLSGDLQVRADAEVRTEASEELDRAWQRLSGPTAPIEARFRVLESDALGVPTLDLENPQGQTARLGVRGELEARGVRSELQLYFRVEVAASSYGRTSPPPAARDERRVTAHCEKGSLVQPLRYGLDLRESRRPGRSVMAAEVGCELTFVAHRVSSDASLAQKDSQK